MADHIRIGKVEYHHVILAALYALYSLFGYLVCAHFRLKVVCRHLGRWYQHPVLIRIGRFNAAIEEERDMGIFFGFGYAQLLQAVL